VTIQFSLIILAVSSLGALGQAAPSKQQSKGPEDWTEILRIRQYHPKELPLEFIFFRNGVLLFGRSAPSIGLNWHQLQLQSQQTAALVELLKSKEFRALKSRYSLPPLGNDIGNYSVCSAENPKRWVEVEMSDVVSQGESSSASEHTNQTQRVPRVLTRLLSLLGGLKSGKARPWEPSWIDLSLGDQASAWHDTSHLPGPARDLPREWLHDATRPDENTIRLPGRYRSAVQEFLAERDRSGPIRVDGREVHMTIEPVIPGRTVCELNVVLGEPLPAAREPTERPPRERRPMQ